MKASFADSPTILQAITKLHESINELITMIQLGLTSDKERPPLNS